MSVGLNADADYANRNTNIGGVGIAGFTLAGWCYRVSGVGQAATALSAICAVAHSGNGRHVALRYNDNFGSGTENDPQLIIEDNGGAIATFGASDDQMPFDTWCFCYIRSGAAAGTVEASWTDDDGATWHTASGTNTTETSVQGEVVLLGRGNVGDANTMYGRYAYWQAFDSDIGQAAARALINKSESDSTEWAFWRLASNTDTADTSGNGRTLTFNGTFTSEADPTIPSAGGGVTVTPSVGTLRTVGQAPTVGFTRSAAPSAGTLRLVGQTPTVGVKHSAAPSAGTLRVDGQQPSVSFTDSTVITPSAGTLAFVGDAPSVAFTDHVTVTPSVGALLIAGQQPGVTSTAAQAAAPSAGTLRLDGQQPAVAYTDHMAVAPSVGTLRLDGQPPTATHTDHQSAAPSAGILTIVGQTPTLAQAWPFDQALYPTAVSLTNLTGAYTDIDESPDDPDGGWLLAA